MFCGKCGTKNADDAVFCAACGAKLNERTVNTGSTPISFDANNKNRKVGMIAVIIGLVAIIGIGVALFGGRGYKKTVNKYIKAQFDGDTKTIFKLMPDDVVDNMLEEDGYDKDELDKLIDEVGEDLEDYMDSIERYYGEGWKVSHEILAVEKVTGDELDDLKEEYEDTDVKVSAAKTVEVELTIKGEETEASTTVEIPVIKIGRSWYLDMLTMGSIF